MKTNIVIFEMNPEHLDVYRIPDNVMTPRELDTLTSIAFNCDEATGDDWLLYEKFSESVEEAAMSLNGVEKLKCPFETLPGEFVYHVFIMM